VIRAVAPGASGPVIILGITSENVRRLQDGKPITLELGQLIRTAREAMREAPLGKLQLAIMYGETHRAVVDELTSHGVALPPDAAAQADAIDETL
jgi:hypothetical protein